MGCVRGGPRRNRPRFKVGVKNSSGFCGGYGSRSIAKTGIADCVFVPLPSWPELLNPQQKVSPEVVTPQA